MELEDYAFGIDLSRYNTSADGKKKVNFDEIACSPMDVSFIAMRAGVSWGYQDPWFAYYMNEAKRINKVRLAYHVVYPGENAAAQMDNFFRILGNINYEEVPLVLDLELSHGCSKAKITKTSERCLEIIFDVTGMVPFIYSRTSWINEHIEVKDLPACLWWLAQYRWPRPYPLYTPEYKPPPNPLPNGVENWAIMQTGSRCASIGSSTYFMDYNRFNGTNEDLKALIGELPKKYIK